MPHDNLEMLLEQFPVLLTEAERLLPQERRHAVLQKKVSMLQGQMQQKKAAAAAASAAAAGANNAQPRLPPGGGAPPQPNQQLQPPNANSTPKVAQSPRVAVQQGLPQASAAQQMQMQMNGQQMNGQQMNGQQMNGQQVNGQNQAYQDQVRMQQQVLHQHHINVMLQKSQQLQQQSLHQQQQPQQMSHHGTPNMTAPSPQQHPAASSPSAQMLGRSPNPNGQRNASTPAPMSSISHINIKQLVESFPKLLEMKQAGRLAPEQEKLFESLINTPEGRAQLNRIQVHQASVIVQNHLNNPIGQPHGGQQQPGVQQNQLATTGMPQLTPFQLQQMQQQGMQPNGPPPGVMPNQQMTSQSIHTEQLVALQQQLQVRQLAQAQANMGRPPTTNQLQQLANANQALQAAALARAAHNQLLQVQGQLGQQPLQQPQQQHTKQEQGNIYVGSPQPPAPNQSMVRPGPAVPQDRLPAIKATLQKLGAMSDGNREELFSKRPDLRNLWHSNMANQSAQLQHTLQTNQLLNGQMQPPPGTPGTNTQTPNFQNIPLANNVHANLHIPVNKQRNVSQQAGAAATATSGAPMRPPQSLQNDGAPTQQQVQAIQRMIQQGIPIAGAAQTVRPSMAGLAMFQQGQDIKPQMLLEQMRPRAEANSGQHGPPTQFRRQSDHAVPLVDRAASLLSQVEWQPSADYDAALKAKITGFQPSLRQSGRSTLSQGMGITRVLGDVLLERMPEGLRAIADDAESGLVADVEMGKGGRTKSDTDSSGMPGQKRRKVQDLANTIDKGLEIDREVETLMLQIADEHSDLISQVSCSLAKHRRSDTVDRKDVQLAYECILGRAIPGFSSDSIRLDQARSTKRSVHQSRLNKLKLVNEAKGVWRKEREEARTALISALKEGVPSPGMEGGAVAVV